MLPDDEFDNAMARTVKPSACHPRFVGRHKGALGGGLRLSPETLKVVKRKGAPATITRLQPRMPKGTRAEVQKHFDDLVLRNLRAYSINTGRPMCEEQLQQLAQQMDERRAR